MTEIFTGYTSAIALGAGFGFYGAVSPGPLQTLIISETLSNGVRSSWRASLAPLMCDPIALAIALFCVSHVPDWTIALIAFGGATVLTRIALAEIKTTAEDFDFQKKHRRSLLQIWIVNMSNPNLWIGAFTLNGLWIHNFWEKGGVTLAVAYIVSYFISIVATYLAMAILVGVCKKALNTNWLARVNRVLGVMLLVMALMFIWLGLQKIGLVTEPKTAPEQTYQLLRTNFEYLISWENCACLDLFC